MPIIVTPYVPTYITVHLGTPDSDAENVTVSFLDYIKNVASSEVYPTWVGSTTPTILGLYGPFCSELPVNFNFPGVFCSVNGVYHNFFDQQAGQLPVQDFHFSHITDILFQLFALSIRIASFPQRFLQLCTSLF